MEKTILTYSSLNTFRNCRRKYFWRYEKELVPYAKDKNLFFGSLIHKCLEVFHSGEPKPLLMSTAMIVENYNEAESVEAAKAFAMISQYIMRHQHEPYAETEVVFQGMIRNPRTGRARRGLRVCGKADGIYMDDGKAYLVEHKTASRLDGNYLEKLWSDFQITLYAHYLEQAKGIAIEGVIYNILVKSMLRRGAKESFISYQDRLLAQYQSQDMFHREKIYFSRDQFDSLKRQLWELSRQIMDAKRRGAWLPNTARCFDWNRRCEYLDLCAQGDPETVCSYHQAGYEHKPAHSELAENNESGLPF